MYAEDSHLSNNSSNNALTPSTWTSGTTLNAGPVQALLFSVHLSQKLLPCMLSTQPEDQSQSQEAPALPSYRLWRRHLHHEELGSSWSPKFCQILALHSSLICRRRKKSRTTDKMRALDLRDLCSGCLWLYNEVHYGPWRPRTLLRWMCGESSK